MPEEKKITLLIEGMDCSHCAVSVTRTIEKRGLKEVNVNFATGEGSFIAPVNCDLELIKKDIAKLGYKVVSDDLHSQKIFSKGKKGLSGIEKKIYFLIDLYSSSSFSYVS